MTSQNISIIIPLFNKSSYIQLVLEALLDQIDDSDEIIVVDDLSTDDSSEVVREVFSQIPNQSQLIVLSENLGPASARNIGANAAKSAYLLFFDADDIPSPLLISSLRATIETQPLAKALVYQIAYQARGETLDIAFQKPRFSVTIHPCHSFAIYALRGKILCTASSTCVDRDYFFSLGGGFQSGLRYCEDTEFWTRLSATTPIVEINAKLAIYRDVTNSQSYGLRGVIGSVNPYIKSLIKLSEDYGSLYLSLARLMLFKNIFFCKSVGAKNLAIYQQLLKYRQLLGLRNFTFLAIVNILPSVVFRSILDIRSRVKIFSNTRLRRRKNGNV